MSDDKRRLDWLEVQTKASPTGISFDYCLYAERGVVVEKGYRFMRHHKLGLRFTTIRAAIDAEMGEATHE